MLTYYIRCETVKKSLLVTPDLQKNQQSHVEVKLNMLKHI